MEGLIRNGLEGSIWAEEFSLENLLQKKTKHKTIIWFAN